MGRDELLERYEAYGGETLYVEAKRLFEEALVSNPGDARLLNQYGYLQYCRGRRAIRDAADCYQRAIDADPQWQKPHLQLIGALAALEELDTVIPRYQQRLADAPSDPESYRLLALACLRAHHHDQAAQAIRAGLEIAPDDPALVELQGDLYAATGRPEDALTCWQRAYTLAPDGYGISMRYSAADLLEHQERLAEAAAEWRFIIRWCEERRYTITADWPKQELQRLEARIAGG